MEHPGTELAEVPDTLDLCRHARLAIGHMVANHDPETGYPYFYLNVHASPPSVSHNAWDLIDQLSRYIDSLLLAREMTGDCHGLEVEQRYRRLLLESLNPEDGLAYRPEVPWSLYEAEMFDQSRALNALVTWYLKEGDDRARQGADRMVQGLWRSAIHVVYRRAGYAYCYYPYASRFRDGWNPATPGEPCCYSGGALILPLVRWAEATGSEQALELARRFLHYIVDESGIFRPDGSFWPREMHLAAGHFHTRSLSMAGVLSCGLLTGERDWVEWARRAFDWALSTSGSFGWFPEGVGTETFYTTKHSETCSITDMLHLALGLAEAGRPEYWTHAERFVRNHLVESQWTREDWLSEETPEEAPSGGPRMRDRLMGGYAGRTLPHEFAADGLMLGCCCGAGPRALFQAWQSALTRRPDGLRVNLLLNRFSSQADVLSCLPYEGRVEVRMGSEGPLHLRLPQGTTADTAALQVNGRPRQGTLRDGFLCLEGVGPGDRVTLQFPLTTREAEEPLLDWPLKLRWRGDTVLSMLPEGRRLPLYQGRPTEGAECPRRPWSPAERRDASFRG